MKLFFSPASPFVRKVMVTLHETGQLDDVERLDVATTPINTDSGLASSNPLGKIPALVRDDGPALMDSRVICRFLDARAEAGLYPESRLWEVLTLEAMGDGLMDAAVSMTYEARFREAPSEAWIDAQWGKIARTLDVLNARWMSHLHGPMDAGHIAIGCALGYLDLRHDARNWRQGRDALVAWEKAFAARPSMQATAPQG